METQRMPLSSSDQGAWTWIILAGLLVIGGLVGVGSLTLINATINAAQQAQTPAVSQPSQTR